MELPHLIKAIFPFDITFFYDLCCYKPCPGSILFVILYGGLDLH